MRDAGAGYLPPVQVHRVTEQGIACEAFVSDLAKRNRADRERNSLQALKALKMEECVVRKKD